ncbi:hypothetical protein NUW58_g9658 [Xylaria curta]|uniref:Uncharacterized protein n=1 Tax=Xylaria curta TaxID=42375 RepID=A0ACC1MU85_9PEZI|nr:hypothetical protein NUW58_g9658 [Xylaria curta]
MSNPVDEGFERSPGIPMKSLGPKKHHSMERAQGQAQPLVVAMHEQKTDQSELPQQDTSIHIRSPTKRSHDEIRRQSPSDFENGSPRSPEKPSQPLANILVRGKLAVPKENLPPESPGFPNMLAAINFPSPPKGSRPSSAASTAPSVASGQVPAGSRPMVQPRTSSRRACAPTSVSAASLDEIILQKRPSSRRVNLDRPSRVAAAATPPSTTIEASSISGLPTTSVEEVDTAGGVVPDEAGRGQTGRAGLTGPFREESRVTIRGDNQRESLASQLTVTTNSSRQSTPTFSSPRSSSASEVSTQSNVTITDPKSFGGTAPSLGRTNPPVSEKSPKMDAVLFKTSVIDKDGVDWTEMDCPDLDRKHGEPKRPNLRLSTVPDQNVEDNPPPKSIIERRIARKAKVREYKMRDLDASRVDVADSPVLGYFAPTLGPNATSQGSTAPINNVRRPSTLSMATTTSELSNEPASHNAVEAPVDLRDVRSARVERSQTETVGDVPGVPPVPLRLSAIVSTEIEPIYPTTPRWHTSGITMSPIMVVADVESAPGSPMLRISALARPDSPSPRTMPRLNPLRISSHSRHKSQTVTISRNPATVSLPCPTPPMTPEPAHRKRLSLPPVQLNLQLTPRDRTPPVRCQEWEVLYVEEGEPESRLRSTTLKERVMREKLQKEKEITDIVAKTVGLPQKQAVYDDEPDSLPLEHNNAENLEKRVERLERTNDAWLCAMKPLLETMARTLDDMRVDDRCRSLKMSDFVIDMEAEAKRVTHSRRGEKEWASMTLQGTSGVESIGTQLKNAPETLIPTPLSPIPQELDTSPVTETRAAPTTSRTGRGPPGNEEKQPILPQEEEICELPNVLWPLQPTP